MNQVSLRLYSINRVHFNIIKCILRTLLVISVSLQGGSFLYRKLGQEYSTILSALSCFLFQICAGKDDSYVYIHQLWKWPCLSIAFQIKLFSVLRPYLILCLSENPKAVENDENNLALVPQKHFQQPPFVSFQVNLKYKIRSIGHVTHSKS